MAFTYKKQAFTARINEVRLGTGDHSLTIGGANTYPFYTFDAPTAHKPVIAVEVRDTGLAGETAPGMLAFYEGCKTPVEIARRAAQMEGASAICLRFESADPNGADTPAEACAALAADVARNVDLPLIVMGCGSFEKDAQIHAACAEALAGYNALMLSAREENYRSVAETAGLRCGQKVGAESAVDINLAKQLNVLLTQMKLPAASICMDLGSSAAGYGFEYLASTMDRVRAAALAQNDAMLQMPVVTPVCVEAWGTKEAMLPESEAPEWGPREQRGVEMEIATASACLISGSDLVILRHPEAVSAISRMIDSLA